MCVLVWADKGATNFAPTTTHTRMSNSVRELYGLIIDQVVKETKSEFEESGDDPAVPEMLRDAWRRRLAEMRVTREPIWSTTNQYGQDAVPKTEPALGLPNLSNMPMPADLSYYGVGHGDAKPKSSGADLVPDMSQDISLDSVTKNTSAVPSINPLGGAGSSTQSQRNAATLSPELQSQLSRAMENHPHIPQTDGPQDEELNSDLDDSEDELNSNDEDDDTDQTQIMLCLYEKVHKVKTRWKYTLKDGIANVNGLDYVFSKATGESEW